MSLFESGSIPNSGNGASPFGIQLRNLQDLSTSFDPSTLSPHERLLAKEAAYKLFRPIENPLEFAVRSGWEHAGTQVSLQIASDLELFPKWRAQNKGATMTGKQLAEMTGVGDVDLLRRFLRQMSADLVLDEVGLDSYAPGPIATAMGDSHGIASLMTFAWLCQLPTYHALPSYLSRTGYVTPTDPHDGPLQALTGPGVDVFTYFATNPKL
ncbi:MAG: hypothetical protein CYPHOPRED_001585, partial [Cyphobasidiales sp. Tagirdzhanova-0007]